MACPNSPTLRLRLTVMGLSVMLCVAACSATGASIPGGAALTADSAPVISGTPAANVVAGQNYTFTPTASVASGGTLTFTIANLPAWASFSISTGKVTGTPPLSSVGTFANIQISVSDGQNTAALPAFAIKVLAPLTISGTPVLQVVAGSPYSFVPSTNAASGAALTFTVQNAPPWAALNPATGELAGTAAQAGTFSNIVIGVSDGSASASLPPFTISVNQVSNGTAALTWTPVTSNTDGSMLTDVAGYRVHYGTSANAMNTVVELANPSLTTYLVTNLSPGTWYFGVTAYASDGTENTVSNIGQKTIP
jgi:Putative Ig domain